MHYEEEIGQEESGMSWDFSDAINEDSSAAEGESFLCDKAHSMETNLASRQRY